MMASSAAAMITAMSGLAALACAATVPGRRGAAPRSNEARTVSPSAAGAPPVEVARAEMGALTATKWRFENGLEAVLLPDPHASSLTYMTWFRVGSRNEDAAAGETGLAHLFEHLMFTQTKTAAANAFDLAIEEAGGSSNAMTYYDFTAYVDDLPPGELALATRLEADRMIHLELRKRQVETERDVVAEERLSSVEDSVDGILDETMYAQAFKTHPYRFPVIGSMKDIRAITADKAIAFYRKYYAPNNAILVVTGNIDPTAALAAIGSAYGGLPASEALPRDLAEPERAPAGLVRTTLVRPLPADRLVIGYPAPPLGADDRAAYEVMSELLAGGPSSRLYRALVVDKPCASSVHGDVAPTRDPGLYAIWIQMLAGHTAEEAERVIDAEVADLATRPIAEAELGRAAARLETAFWHDLGSSHGRAEALGEFEIATGDFRRLFARGADYARVSVADVRRVAGGYLGPGARSVVIARPAETGGTP